eukprot:NODE_32_length_37098_cov_1.132760.p31 type:complete len:106 gc:universal NODE_32_length_37098_cov_1.132760:14647-14964(+)
MGNNSRKSLGSKSSSITFISSFPPRLYFIVFAIIKVFDFSTNVACSPCHTYIIVPQSIIKAPSVVKEFRKGATKIPCGFFFPTILYTRIKLSSILGFKELGTEFS